MSPLLRKFLPVRSMIYIAALGVAAVVAIPGKCQAQDDSNWFFLNAGGGFAPVTGADATSLKNGWNFNAGSGFAFYPTSRSGWRFFLNENFQFDQLGVSPAALANARILNPANIGLLEATSAKAKFYTATLDPTVRFPAAGRFQVYAFAGFGWMRRSLVFTGTSNQGTLLQPSPPAVFGTGGNSGAYDAGGGADFKLARHLRIYGEARVIHGLAVNRPSTLIPVSGGIRWFW